MNAIIKEKWGQVLNINYSSINPGSNGALRQAKGVRRRAQGKGGKK